MKKAIFLTLLSFLILGCSSQQVDEKYANLVGQKYTQEIYTKLGGSVETLPGTNNQKWIAYFPKADITIVENKQTGEIVSVTKGKGD
jgi:hypothetical protein